jgi:hypothetical protein
MMDVEPGHDELLDQWYRDEHVDEMLSCPGFQSIRRYVADDRLPGGQRLPKEVGESPKYLTIYEVDSPDALQSSEYKTLLTKHTPRSEAIAPYFVLRARRVYREVSRDSRPRRES